MIDRSGAKLSTTGTNTPTAPRAQKISEHAYFAWKWVFKYRSTIAIAIVGLIAIISVFSWAWRFEHLRPYSATLASAIAAALLASAPFAPSRFVWVLMLTGATFTGWVTWFTVFDFTKKEKQLESLKIDVATRDYRIKMLQGYVKQFIALLPLNEKPDALTILGTTIDHRFQEALPGPQSPVSDEAVSDATDIMYALDKNNGHALYFSGELDWHRHKKDNGETQFYAYLEEEQRTKPQFRKNDLATAACRNPKGFCQERTAWIHHLMANALYQKAVDQERSGPPPLGVWLEALEQTCGAKILFKNTGFAQLTSTATLEQEIEKRLSNKRCRQPNRSDYFENTTDDAVVIDVHK